MSKSLSFGLLLILTSSLSAPQNTTTQENVVCALAKLHAVAARRDGAAHIFNNPTPAEVVQQLQCIADDLGVLRDATDSIDVSGAAAGRLQLQWISTQITQASRKIDLILNGPEGKGGVLADHARLQGCSTLHCTSLTEAIGWINTLIREINDKVSGDLQRSAIPVLDSINIELNNIHDAVKKGRVSACRELPQVADAGSTARPGITAPPQPRPPAASGIGAGSTAQVPGRVRGRVENTDDGFMNDLSKALKGIKVTDITDLNKLRNSVAVIEGALGVVCHDTTGHRLGGVYRTLGIINTFARNIRAHEVYLTRSRYSHLFLDNLAADITALQAIRSDEQPWWEDGSVLQNPEVRNEFLDSLEGSIRAVHDSIRKCYVQTPFGNNLSQCLAAAQERVVAFWYRLLDKIFGW